MEQFENRPLDETSGMAGPQPVHPPQNPWFAPAPMQVDESAAAAVEPVAVHEPVQEPQPVQMPPLTAEPQPIPQQVPVYAPVYERSYTQVRPDPAAAQPRPEKSKAAPKKKSSGGKSWKGILCAVLVVVLVGASSFGTAWLMGKHFDKSQAELRSQLAALEKRIEAEEKRVQTPVTVPSGSGQSPAVTVPTGDYLTPAQVYQQNLNSVVLIENVVSNGYYSGGGTGSGFILSADGYVVTNYHVVEGNGKLSVVTYDGTKYDAKLVGFDSANDVALLKVEAEGLRAVTVGDSDALIVGDQVAAIGNPLGELTSTMTVGYVSAKERDVNTSGFAINMIQTDAAINSGNSGGPLFNMYGQVVGITSAKYSGSSSSGATIEGIGFAIPINDVLPLLEDLMTNGYETGPYLGVSVQDMDAANAEYYGLPMGAYVSEVVRGHCAEKAGVQVRDIITKLGGHSVGSVNELTRALRSLKAGDTVEMVVCRSGKEVILTITLDQKPQQNELQQEQTQEEQSQDSWMESLIPGWG